MSEPLPAPQKRGFGRLILLAVIALALIGAFTALRIHQHKVFAGVIPSSLRPGFILYEKSRYVGFKPSDTHMVVFALPAESAAAVERAGVSYFDGHDGEWLATPMAFGSDDPDERQPDTVGIANFLARNDLEISIDRNVEREVDHAINSPGSFYRFGPGSRLIIVAPKQQRIFLAYAG